MLFFPGPKLKKVVGKGSKAESISELYAMYVCVFMALMTTLVLCARSSDLVMSVSVRRVHVVLSTGRFKGGGKPCHKTHETAALRRGIQKTLST